MLTMACPDSGLQLYHTYTVSYHRNSRNSSLWAV